MFIGLDTVVFHTTKGTSVLRTRGQPSKRVPCPAPCRPPASIQSALHQVFGTATGTILLTDYHGNETRRIRPHKKAVTDLSMDITGDFLARQAVTDFDFDRRNGRGSRHGGGRGVCLDFYRYFTEQCSVALFLSCGLNKAYAAHRCRYRPFTVGCNSRF